MQQAVQELYPALERLSRLVSQLLSLARNEPDAVLAVPMTPLDLNALALEVAAGWVPEALKQGVDLGLEGSVEPAMIAGDAGRLRELLDNLLDNAIRYSGRAGGGRVTVRVSAAPAARGRSERRWAEHTGARARACIRALSPARSAARATAAAWGSLSRGKSLAFMAPP